MVKMSTEEYLELTQIMINLVGIKSDDPESGTKIMDKFLAKQERLKEVADAAKVYIKTSPENPTGQQKKDLELAKKFVDIYGNALRSLEILKTRADMSTGSRKYTPSTDAYPK